MSPLAPRRLGALLSGSILLVGLLGTPVTSAAAPAFVSPATGTFAWKGLGRSVPFSWSADPSRVTAETRTLTLYSKPFSYACAAGSWTSEQVFPNVGVGSVSPRLTKPLTCYQAVLKVTSIDSATGTGPEVSYASGIYITEGDELTPSGAFAPAVTWRDPATLAFVPFTYATSYELRFETKLAGPAFPGDRAPTIKRAELTRLTTPLLVDRCGATAGAGTSVDLRVIRGRDLRRGRYVAELTGGACNSFKLSIIDSHGRIGTAFSGAIGLASGGVKASPGVEQSRKLSVGGTGLSGTLEAARAYDYFSLALKARQSFEIEILSDRPIDAHFDKPRETVGMSAIDGAHQQLADGTRRSTFFGEAGKTGKLFFWLSPQTFYIGSDGIQTGFTTPFHYEIRVRSRQSASGRQSASPVATPKATKSPAATKAPKSTPYPLLKPGRGTSGTMTRRDEMFAYRISAKAGTRLRIELNSPGEVSAVSLGDWPASDPTTVVTRDAESTTTLYEVTVNKSGIYTFAVEPGGANPTFPLPFEIRVSSRKVSASAVAVTTPRPAKGTRPTVIWLTPATGAKTTTVTGGSIILKWSGTATKSYILHGYSAKKKADGTCPTFSTSRYSGKKGFVDSVDANTSDYRLPGSAGTMCDAVAITGVNLDGTRSKAVYSGVILFK